MHGLVTDQFAAQYGRIKGQETAILAMGRLGSREMTASSDLDLILLYDFDHEQPDSDGERSLHGAQYFARLTQRLISAFTTRTNYGVLYEVDMRLRPSGRAGPAGVADRFLCRLSGARGLDLGAHGADPGAGDLGVAGVPRAGSRTSSASVLTRPRDPAATASDVADMRRAIALEKGEDDIWDLKYAAGGMVDIDFIAQYLQLVHAAEKPDILRRLHAAGARQRRAARRAAAIRGRDAALGGAALSRPDADPAALRQRKIQAGNRGRRPAARDGARRRRAGLSRRWRRGCGRRRARCGGCFGRSWVGRRIVGSKRGKRMPELINMWFPAAQILAQQA